MTERTLYTIVLAYKGGTYIAQVSGESPAKALPKWLSEARDEQWAKWGISRDELTTITKTNDPIAVSGCQGVWCLSGSAKNGLALINIIATDRAER